jgi:hypothetical protein
MRWRAQQCKAQMLPMIKASEVFESHPQFQPYVFSALGLLHKTAYAFKHMAPSVDTLVRGGFMNTSTQLPSILVLEI